MSEDEIYSQSRNLEIWHLLDQDGYLIEKKDEGQELK